MLTKEIELAPPPQIGIVADSKSLLELTEPDSIKSRFPLHPPNTQTAFLSFSHLHLRLFYDTTHLLGAVDCNTIG